MQTLKVFARELFLVSQIELDSCFYCLFQKEKIREKDRRFYGNAGLNASIFEAGGTTRKSYSAGQNFAQNETIQN